MKLAAVTMRIDAIADRVEVRESLDVEWASFLDVCGFATLALPNRPDVVEALLARTKPEAVVLTGGGDVSLVTGHADARDRIEEATIRWAERAGLPIFAVCRGMQAVLGLAGARIVPLAGHCGTTHGIMPAGRTVVSHHRFGIETVPDGWEVLQHGPDGSVEACRNRRLRTLATMWHPERCDPFDPTDVAMVRDHLRGETDRLVGGDS